MAQELDAEFEGLAREVGHFTTALSKHQRIRTRHWLEKVRREGTKVTLGLRIISCTTLRRSSIQTWTLETECS
jgi:hypothetical protein